MDIEVKPVTGFIYTCRDCGYRRPGVLDSSMYATRCPECGGAYYAEAQL